MKIFDLKKYRESRINAPESNFLEQDYKSLLEKIQGTGGSLIDYLKNISNIASVAHLQVFYELLQNAQDANAKSLYAYIDDGYFIAVNNGDIFNTTQDKNGNDSLWSFLCTNKSTKSIDPDLIGEYGIGSKLLYTLLTDADSSEKTSEKITTELVNKNNTLTLFSWSKNQHIRDFADKNINDYTPQEESNNSYPILAKLMYSFMPISPLEKKIDASGKEITLFSNSEINRLKKITNNKTYRFYHKGSYLELSDLPHGSLLSLKLGKGVESKIVASWELIEKGISISLNFFLNKNGVERIVFNGREIKKAPLAKLKEGIVRIENNNIPYTVAYPVENFIELASSENSVENEVNFFRFAPAANEKHGLWLYINTAFSLAADRQQLIWDPFNKSLVIKITDEIIIQAKSKKDSFEDYWYLYRVILLSSLKAVQNEVDKDKYDALTYLSSQLKEFLVDNVPTKNRFFLNSKQVAISLSKLDIPLDKLGIESFEWAYLGETKEEIDLIKKHYTGTSDNNVCLEKKSIKDIIHKANKGGLQNWIQTLAINEYQTLINEIEEEWDSPLYNELKSIKWIKGSDGNWYSFEDYNTQSNKFWIRDSRTVSIYDILKNRLSHIVSAIDFSDKNKINLELLKHFDNRNYYNKVLQSISGDIVPKETSKLTPSDKKDIIKLLKNRLKLDANTVASVVLFQNRNSELVSLNQLIKNDIVKVYSLIPNKYKIHFGEEHSDFEEYQLNETDVFSSLIDKQWHSWVSNLGKLNSKIITTFYEMVQSFYISSSKPNHSLLELNCIYTSQNQLEKQEHCISLEYDANKEFFVANLLQKLNNKKAVHLDVKKIIDDSEFIFHNSIALHEIIPQQINLSFDEAVLLIELCVQNDIKPFEYFWFEETETLNIFKCFKRGYSVANNIGPKQFYTDNTDLSSFLSINQDVYKLIPKQLLSIKLNKTSHALVYDNADSLKKLINKYGFRKEFISKIKEIRDDSLLDEYIRVLPTKFVFIDNLDKSYNSSDFEWVFSELVSRYIILKRGQSDKDISTLKSKLLIEGNPLSNLEWSDLVEITIIKDNIARQPTQFSLSTLLPEYNGKSNILSQAIACFPRMSAQVINNLFESKNKEPNDVVINLADNPTLIDSLEHFRFILAWLYHNNNLSYKNIFLPKIRLLIDSNQLKCLDILFQDNFDFYSQFINFEDWIPLEKAFLLKKDKFEIDIANQKKYLLSDEMLPEWVSTWYYNNPNKLKFLKNCGVRTFEIDSNPIEWRAFFNNDLTKEPNEKQLIEPWGVNTLEWTCRNQNQWKKDNSITSSLQSYIGTVNEKSKDAGFALCYENSSDGYKLIRLSKSKEYGIFESSKNFNKIKEMAIQKVISTHDFDLLIDGIQSLSYLKAKKYQILTLEIKDTIEVDSLEESLEWNAPQYSDNWKEQYQYRIFIHNKDIPSTYSISQAKLITKPIDITINDHAYYFPNPKIYLSQLSINNKGSVEKLLRTLIPEFSNDAILDLYEEKRYSDREDNSKEREVAVSNAEWDLIKLLLENGILSIEDAQNLLDSGKGDKNSKKKRDVQPNIEIGHKGEIILYEYLCYKYGEDRVFWASKEIKEPRYDFVVYNPSGIYRSEDPKDVLFYFDAKTTGQSEITPDSIPFYVKKSQLNFIKNNISNNYILVRLNLNTLQLEKNIFPQITEMDTKENGYQLLSYTNQHSFSNNSEYINAIEAHVDFLNLSEANIKIS